MTIMTKIMNHRIQMYSTRTHPCTGKAIMKVNNYLYNEHHLNKNFHHDRTQDQDTERHDHERTPLDNERGTTDRSWC